MMNKTCRIQFINMLMKNAFVREHLVEFTWTSGESTTVYPIQEWRDRIDIQWASNRPCKKWIDKIVKENGDLIKSGYFSKSDGSCPSCIVFLYKEPILQKGER